MTASSHQAVQRLSQENGAAASEHQKTSFFLKLMAQMGEQIVRPCLNDLRDDFINRGASYSNKSMPTYQPLLRFGIRESNARMLCAKLIAYRTGNTNCPFIQQCRSHPQLRFPLCLMLEGNLTLMELPSTNIQRQMLHNIRLYRSSVNRVVPGNERAEGLWIGIDFDQTHLPGGTPLLFVSAADGVHRIEERS